jgi:hypothetical protein
MTSPLALLFIASWLVLIFVMWFMSTIKLIYVLRNAIHPPQPYSSKKVELNLLYNNTNNTHSESMPAITHTRQVLETMRVGFLKIILTENNLPTSGKKAELVQRILDHQNKLQVQDDAWEQLMIKGSAIQDDEYEKVMQSYTAWCEQNNFNAYKMDPIDYTFSKVHINEIRAEFMDYDPSASPLRNDSLVPNPTTKMDIFLEMFFENLGGIWEFSDESDAQREFEENTDTNSKWFKQGLLEIYNSS